MLFLVINTKNPAYAKFTLPSIQRYCKKYKYPLSFITHEINPEVHPSWYKLICHKVCKASFIVCCDLDIFIMPSAPPIHEVIQYDRINICEDAGARKDKTLFADKFPFFKYNCGLMGIPKTSQHFLEEIYDKYARINEWPCWEQLYVNRALVNKNIDINVLSDKWNCMVYLNKESQLPSCQNWHFKHLTPYTGEPIKRYLWSERHFKFYHTIKLN